MVNFLWTKRWPFKRAPVYIKMSSLHLASSPLSGYDWPNYGQNWFRWPKAWRWSGRSLPVGGDASREGGGGACRRAANTAAVRWTNFPLSRFNTFSQAVQVLCAEDQIKIQSRASYLSHGFEANVLGCSPGWLADTVATYWFNIWEFTVRFLFPPLFE